MSYPDSNRWALSRHTATSAGFPAASSNSRSCPIVRPIEFPCPAVFSRSSVTPFGNFPNERIADAMREIPSSTGSSPHEPGCITRYGTPSMAARDASSSSA